MLHAISWSAFGKAVCFLMLIYYCVIGFLFFREELKDLIRRRGKTLMLLPLASITMLSIVRAQTADANNGLSQANTLIRSYFDIATQVMYAIGAILGLIGAIIVFSRILSGHRDDAAKSAANWFIACIFLVIVATVIKAFFGL